jgi:hypothetical protein
LKPAGLSRTHPPTVSQLPVFGRRQHNVCRLRPEADNPDDDSRNGAISLHCTTRLGALAEDSFQPDLLASFDVSYQPLGGAGCLDLDFLKLARRC